MPAHDEFRELGALAAIGQITMSEHESLSAHLEQCSECREAYLDYSRILRQELPQADPPRFRSKRWVSHGLQLLASYTFPCGANSTFANAFA
jgi:hypothetical protein